jgi:adenosylhomocysteine nucleosidase
MSRTAVIAALPDELRPLVRGWRRERRAGVDTWRRREGSGEWVAACAGMGARAAARALAEAERLGAADAVVSAGWAGALRDEFEVGRAYRVSAVVDARTGERFAAASPGGCVLVTSGRVAGPEEKRRLAAAFGAGIVDMEAAAVARIAAGRGIPFHCVKAISDAPGDLIAGIDGFVSPDGRFRLGRFVLHAAARPWLWPALGRLAGNSRRSAEALGDALAGLLAGL